MPGPTLELNVSVSGLQSVTDLNTALDALERNVDKLDISPAGDLAGQLKDMAAKSKFAMQEMQLVLTTGFAGLEEKLEKFSAGQKRIRQTSADEAESETAKTVAQQTRILQAGYERQLALGEEFSEAQLRIQKAAGVKLSAGHRLSLLAGVSGDVGTGADIDEAGGAAAAQMLAEQKLATERKRLLLEDWNAAIIHNDGLTAAAKKSAAERMAVETQLYEYTDNLGKAAVASERFRQASLTSQISTAYMVRAKLAAGFSAEAVAMAHGFEAASFDVKAAERQLESDRKLAKGRLNLAEKSAAERLAIEKALNVAMSNLGRASVATETFRQASPTSQANTGNMARAKLAAGFTQADVAMAHGFGAALFNADGALNKMSKSATASSGPLKTLANNLGSTHSAARGVASGFNAMWLTWGNVGPLLAGAALSHSFMTAVKEGSKLETTLTSMATLGGQTTAQIASLRKEIDLLAVSGPQGIQDISVALKTLTLAGLSASESGKALNAVMQFALAGELPVERAADVLVSVGTAFGYTANAYSYVANMLTSASAASRASVDSMSASIKQATALNATYGVSLKDVALGIALQAQVGIDYGIAGTSLRNFYADISGRTPKAKKALDELGVSLYHTSGAMKGQLKDLKDLSREIAIGSSGFTDLAKRAEVFNAAFSERGAKPASAFTKEALKVQEVNGKLMTGVEIMAEKIENNLSIVELAAIRMKLTTQSQMQQTANIFQQAFQEAFTKMQPTLIVITNDLKKIFGSEEFKKSISALVVNLASLVKAMVDYREVIFSVVSAVVAYNTLKFGSSIGVAMGQAATGIATAAKAVELGATKTQGLTAAVSGSSAALLAQRVAANAAAGGLAVVDAATTALTGKVTLATRAMAFFHAATGWLGLIAGVLTAAVSGIALYKMYQGKSNDETKAANLTANEFMENLRKEVKERTAVADAIRKGATAQEAKAAAMNAENDAIIENQRLTERKPIAAELTKVKASIAQSEAPVTRGGAYQRDRLSADQLMDARLRQAVLARQLETIDANAVKLSREKVKLAKDLAEQTKFVADAEDRERAAKEKDAAARLKAEQEAANKALGLNGTGASTAETPATAISTLEKKLKLHKDIADQIAGGATPEAAKATAEFLQLPGAAARVNEFTDAWTKANNELIRAEALEKNIRDVRDYNKEVAQLTEENALLEKGNSLKQARAIIEGGKLGFSEPQVKEKSDLESQQEKLLAEQEKWKKLVEDLKSEDPFKGWGKGLSEIFKSSGVAVEQLLAGVQSLNKSQIEGAENLAMIKDQQAKLKPDDVEGAKALAKLEQAQIKKTTQQQLASYATLAAGSKKLFKEHTAGYKTLEAAEKGLRMYQMAMSSAALAQDLSNMAKSVSTFLFGETVKVGATAAGQAGQTAAVTAGEMARNVAKIPGVFMSFMSSLGPYGMAAAGVAVAAVLGSTGAFSSTSGTPADAEAMQKSQGTGTVFGDASAKSESLTKALEKLKDIAEPQLKYTAQMAASLRNIESALVGVSGQIVRSGGKLTGASFAGSETFSSAVGFSDKVLQRTASGTLDRAFLGGVVSNMANRLSKAVFGSTKTTLQDAGLQFGAGSLQSILAGGVGATGYESTQTVKKKLFGLSKQTSYATSSFGLDPNLTSQFTNVIKDVYASITSANTALGISAEATKTKLAGFSVELGRISLKGLNSAQIQEQLTAVFGAFSDRLATAATESVSEFQKAGEGYFETLVRVASETELAKSMLDKLGLSMISYKDITYKQSNVVDELVRQSILAVEGLTSIGEVVNGLTGDAAEIAETYTQLLSIRYALQAFGSAAVSVSASMIAGAGDLDTLAQGAADYTENFLSESERLTKSTSDMARQFSRLGVALPDSNEAFKTLLLGIDGSTEAGQKLYGSVLALSGSFAELSSSAESFDTSKVEMQLAILKAQGKDEQALAIERERILKATDPMLKALQQEVWATEDAAKATQTLTESLNKLNDAGKQISDYLDSLSGQTGAGGLAVSRGTYLSTLSGAKTNDLGALGKITGTASAYLKDAENFSRTSAEYLATVAQVRSELANLEAVKSYKSSLDGSHASGLDYVPFDGYTAQLHKGERVETAAQARQKDEMLAELQAMRVESKATQTAQALNTLLMRKILDKWDQDGMPAVRT